MLDPCGATPTSDRRNRPFCSCTDVLLQLQKRERVARTSRADSLSEPLTSLLLRECERRQPASDGRIVLRAFVELATAVLEQRGIKAQRGQLEGIFHATDFDGTGTVHLPSMLALATVRDYFEAVARVGTGGATALADAAQASSRQHLPSLLLRECERRHPGSDGRMALGAFVELASAVLEQQGLRVRRGQLEGIFHATDFDGTGAVHLPSMLQLATVRDYFEAVARVGTGGAASREDAAQPSAQRGGAVNSLTARLSSWSGPAAGADESTDETGTDDAPSEHDAVVPEVLDRKLSWL